MTTRTPPPPGRLFVTVGTDVHPFDRLVVWTDAWLRSSTAAAVTCLVQGGTSRPSMVATWRERLAHPEMLAELRRATVVVCHGGPATIMDCREGGLVPIVVPRRPELGEHVDDHQVRFAERLARLGHVTVASTFDDLASQLDDAVEDPASRRLDSTPPAIDLAIDRFGTLVDELLRSSGRRLVRR